MVNEINTKKCNCHHMDYIFVYLTYTFNLSPATESVLLVTIARNY